MTLCLPVGPPRPAVQLFLLTVVAMSGIFARTTLGPLQETMRIALLVSDNQMALLQGPALALPLLIFAIPLGLLIDRHSRVLLLLFATVLNITATAAAGLADSFAMLVAARCIVGLAAPATAIAAYSLLADLYDPGRRGRATTAVMLGQVGGSAAAFAFGGELLGVFSSDPQSWRWAMLVMAACMIPAIGAALLMREPARTGAVQEKIPVRQVWPQVLRYRSIILTLMAGIALMTVADAAALVWIAPTLARRFDLAPDRIGAIIALVLMISGIAGPVIAGPLADFCQRIGGPRRIVAALSVLAALMCCASCYALMPTVALVSGWFAVFHTIGSAISLMTTATAIVAVPGTLRGLCVSIKFASGTVFGLGLAPPAVSFLSGVTGGPETIGIALTIVCAATSFLGAAAFAFGTRYFPRTAVQ